MTGINAPNSKARERRAKEEADITFTNILALLTGSKDDDVVLGTAFATARRFNAHVSAAFTARDSRESVPVSEMPMLPEMVQQIVLDQDEIVHKAKAYARGAFERAAHSFGAILTKKVAKGANMSASYAEYTGHQVPIVEQVAFFADLIVFPPLTHTFNKEAHETFIRLLTKAERPVLLSPLEVPEEVGNSVAIGWDGGLAAGHALVAALPFLEKAQQIRLLCVRRHNMPSRLDIARAREFLALHGVQAEEETIEADLCSTGEALIDAAVERAADLLVVGGYGHSRMVESIFGGTTAHVVSHPAIPVLIVH